MQIGHFFEWCYIRFPSDFPHECRGWTSYQLFASSARAASHLDVFAVSVGHWWLMPVGVLLWYPLHYYIYMIIYVYLYTNIIYIYIYHYISTELQYWELAPMNSVSPWNQQVFFPTPIHYKHLTATFRRPNFSGWIILWPQKDPKISNLEAFFVFIVFDV